MEKEEIVTSENSIYIDGLRLSQLLLDLAKEYADFKTAGEFRGLMMALHIVYYECVKIYPYAETYKRILEGRDFLV